MKALKKSKPKMLKLLLQNATPDLLNAFSECSLNILKGNVRLTPHQKRILSRHKRQLRDLSKTNTSNVKKRKILQTGGFIGAILNPVLGVLGSILNSV